MVSQLNTLVKTYFNIILKKLNIYLVYFILVFYVLAPGTMLVWLSLSTKRILLIFTVGIAVYIVPVLLVKPVHASTLQ